MFEPISNLGLFTKDLILTFAATLGGNDVPGVIVLLLLLCLGAVGAVCWLQYRAKIKAIEGLRARVSGGADRPFSQTREELDARAEEAPSAGAHRSVADAWLEFSDTLVLDTLQNPPTLRNTVRPSAFFNVDDLHFSGGFFKIIPGIFVSIGLALTFLGLIAALSNMGSGGAINDATMSELLKIASAKFIMSLTGLVCSIVFTLLLRWRVGRLEYEIHRLCLALEKKLSFSSLEFLGYEQLRAFKDAQEHNRQLTTEVIAELGRPLREDLPNAISSSISSAMQPLLEQVGRQGSDSMSTLATNLSDQLTGSIGAALTAASDKLAQAGERIGALSDRMDQSSGRIGSEMEHAVARVAAAIEELRAGMAASAESTSGVFSRGAEQMMAVMNKTLEGIRENTAEGAKAMSVAAEDMRHAAAGMRTEMETAARSGAEAAQARMQAAGAEAGSAIDSAGRSVLDAFGKAGAEIATLAGQLSAKAGQDLLDPITAVAGQLEGMVGALEQGTTEVRRASDAVREGAKAGAEAAGNFRAAAQELTGAALPVRATSEKIEGSLRQLTDGLQAGLSSVTRSAEATAQSAAQVLDAARATLASERDGIEKSLASVGDMLQRMRGQGERLDTIDQKLGAAFDLYTGQTEAAMQSIRSHVQEMSKGLNIAVQQLDNAIQNLQEFTPEQARR